MGNPANASRLIVWCNIGLPEPELQMLRDGLDGHELRLSSEAPDALAESDIAFGQPDPEILLSSPRLRWAHLSSAGYTRYDRDDLSTGLPARGKVLTNSSHVYDEPCAQHALAMILALARELPQALESQRSGERWETGSRRRASFLLSGEQIVLLLGFGAIGRRLAELLQPFGVRLIAVRRSVAPETGIEVIGESDLERVLPLADHVVNILPESPQTRGFMTAGRLAQMKAGSRFYNIGRGATVDQPALIEALDSGHLAAAYLDVTEPEPLPAGHPLWSAPNCFITPHSAGGHDNETERLVRHFLANFERYTRGEALLDRVF